VPAALIYVPGDGWFLIESSDLFLFHAVDPFGRVTLYSTDCWVNAGIQIMQWVVLCLGF